MEQKPKNIKLLIKLPGDFFFEEETRYELTVTKYLEEATTYDKHSAYGMQEMKKDIERLKGYFGDKISLVEIKTEVSMEEIQLDDFKWGE